MKKLAYMLLFVVLLPVTVYGQKIIPQAKPDTSRVDLYDFPRFGLFGQYSFNFHRADFLASQVGVPSCCPRFRNDEGSGFALGVLYEMPLSRQFMLGFRLGYFDRSATLEATENETFYNYAADEPAPGIIRHTLETSISTLALEPQVHYRFFDNLALHLGFNISFGTINKKYTHNEKIIEPLYGAWENGARTRLQSTGNLDSLNSFGFGLLAGLSYEIPLTADKHYILAPEVFYNPMLTDFGEKANWKTDQLRFGLALKYMPYTISVKPVTLLGDINAVGLFDDGMEKQIVEIKVEEFLQTRLKPLLGYVFFDDNSSEIPARYVKLSPGEAEDFKVEDMHYKGVMETYYNVLNIIGRRLIKNPSARIVIVGCNSNTGAETGNKELSMNRALNVRDYLQNAWNIDPERMVITERNLPATPSRPGDPDGIEENRRVEISSLDPHILAPVISEDTVKKVSPPSVKFVPSAESEAGLRNWSVYSKQRGVVLFDYTGFSEVPQYVIWNVEKNPATIPEEEVPLEYNLTLMDKQGNVFKTPNKNIPVKSLTITKKQRLKIADRFVDKYSLILFEFDKADLNERHRRIVDFIKQRTYPNSEITIEGYTDRLGDNQYNQNLSTNRAKTVAESFPGYRVKSIGHGEDESTYKNNLPEGRFYSRRVDITVETPEK